MELSNKIALVTGGASGLGLATSKMLVQSGAAVVIADLAGSQGSSVAQEIGDRARFVPTDVTSPHDAQAAVEMAAGTFGGLHILVNCAGIATPGRVLTRDGDAIDLDRFERVVRVNLVGGFNLIRVAAAQMVTQEPENEERGVIVNTASIAAFDGQVGQAAYAASKGGIVGMTLPLARDLSNQLIRCASIAPGIFDTPMLEGLPAGARTQLAEAIPHPQRLGRPDEFAALVRHIIENPMINGATIRLDGALRMGPR